jgi:hypothetical protein
MSPEIIVATVSFHLDRVWVWGRTVSTHIVSHILQVREYFTGARVPEMIWRAESEECSVDDGEALQVDFEFGDPEEGDFEIIKALTQHYVDIPNFDCVSFSDIITDKVWLCITLYLERLLFHL